MIFSFPTPPFSLSFSFPFFSYFFLLRGAIEEAAAPARHYPAAIVRPALSRIAEVLGIHTNSVGACAARGGAPRGSFHERRSHWPELIAPRTCPGAGLMEAIGCGPIGRGRRSLWKDARRVLVLVSYRARPVCQNRQRNYRLGTEARTGAESAAGGRKRSGWPQKLENSPGARRASGFPPRLPQSSQRWPYGNRSAEGPPAGSRAGKYRNPIHSDSVTWRRCSIPRETRTL